MAHPVINRLAPPTAAALFKTGLALASALPLAGLAPSTWWDFEDERHDAEAKLATAVMIVKGHAARSLLVIDALLASAAQLIERGGLDGLRTEAQWHRLCQIGRRLPKTGEIFIFDRDGNRIAATPFYPASANNISDYEWFRQLKKLS
jgi:hypothetical protein